MNVIDIIAKILHTNPNNVTQQQVQSFVNNPKTRAYLSNADDLSDYDTTSYHNVDPNQQTGNTGNQFLDD